MNDQRPLESDSPFDEPPGPLSERLLRLVFMLLFWGILCVAGYVLGILVLVSCLFAVISGNPQPRLREFASSLSTYIYQILRFLTYNSEQKPFPFADWPQADDNPSS